MKQLPFEIKEVNRDRGTICNDLLRVLPLWFGIESAIQQYISDVETMPMFVAFQEAKSIGFVSLNLHNEWTAEIHVMAIHPDFHRKQIGYKLVKAAESYLKERAYQFLSVKTLSPSRPNREYEITRKFYTALGFRPVEEFKTLWGEGSPCLLMIKSI